MSVQRLDPVSYIGEAVIMHPKTEVSCLYILIRNDLESMCAGKAAAQAAHAANRFIFNLRKQHSGSRHYDAITWWEDECSGFGTTITLGCDVETLLRTVNMFEEGEYPCGVVNDPTYPLKDGDFVHYLDIVTTGYIFVADKNDELDPAVAFLKNIPLFAGYQKKLQDV